ncbi:MAG: metal-dependent hydrolase [Candidatus Heimdallarchaeota archaeon]
MDPLTHIAIAYCLIFWIQKFKKIPAKFMIPYLIGAVIPDLDIFFNWVVYLAPKLYWLEHRGMGHSIVGVIPYVILTAVTLNFSKIKRSIWKEEKYPDLDFWSWEGIMFLYLGTLTHLLTDFFVPTGLMLFFPFSFKWYGLKILSTNNIHSILAAVFVLSIFPLNWNKRRRNIALTLFIISITFYSAVRVAVNINSSKVFEDKYGSSDYSSSELIFTYNVNYKVYDSTDNNNKTYVIAIIDGMQKKIVEEFFIPEIKIIDNASISQILQLVNVTRENSHYYRLWQKNQIVCAEVQKETDNSWLIRWFAPIREAEMRTKIGFIDYTGTTEVVFHITESGVITKIDRPLAI